MQRNPLDSLFDGKAKEVCNLLHFSPCLTNFFQFDIHLFKMSLGFVNFGADYILPTFVLTLIQPLYPQVIPFVISPRGVGAPPSKRESLIFGSPARLFRQARKSGPDSFGGFWLGQNILGFSNICFPGRFSLEPALNLTVLVFKFQLLGRSS